MRSLYYKAPDSNVETVIQFSDDADLHFQIDDLVNEGNLLICDHDAILDLLERGFRKVAIDDELCYEVTEVNCGDCGCDG